MSLFSYAQMQLHTDKLRAVLDSYSKWKLNGTTVSPDYIYRNGAPLTALQNLASTASLSLSSKIATIPAAAFGTDSVIYLENSDSTISSATVSGGVKVSVNHGFTKDEFVLQGKALGGTVKLQRGKNADVENYTLR